MSVSSPELLGLSCEIADTLNLLAPRGWNTVQLALDNRGGQLRVVSVDAKLSGAPGPKPELGMDAPARLMGMSAAFTDVLHQLHHDGVNWSGTRAQVSRPRADHLVVTLLNDDGRPASSWTVTSEYLEALFLSEPFLDALAAAESEISRRHAELAARIQGTTSWTYAQPERLLSFAFADRAPLQVPAQILGTWTQDEESWLWGWANTSIEPACTDRVEAALQPDAHEPGFAVFWREKYPCEDGFAGQVAALAAHRMGARGVYRGRAQNTWAYFAILG